MSRADERDDDLLLAVAEDIAQGRAIDWEVAGSAATPELTARLARLRELAGLQEAFADAQPPPPLPAGDEPLFVWGHLLVLAKLGEGSFGEVYRARDPLLDRDVALKLRRSDAGDTTESSRRYLREARRLARVRHPNVLVVHGAAVHDGRTGLWTDLLPGQTLAQLLAARGPLPPAETIAIGSDLARALAAVHEAGLLHGDVKADNVMREPDGRIVLMDFGGGGELSALGETAMSRGTPVVLAPEVLRGEPATTAADVYSLGVLLYRLVTGSYPVDGSNLEEIARRHARGEAIPLRQRRPDLPAAFGDVVERAMAAEPALRPPSAAALARELEALQAGTAARRRRGVAVAAVALAAALALTAYLLRERAGGGAPAPAPPRPAVAVVAFPPPGAGSGSRWLAPALAELLAAELAASGELRAIGGEQVGRARRELPLARAEDLTTEILRRLRTGLGADFVAVASLGAPASARLPVALRLHDTATGERLLALDDTLHASELSSFAARAGSRLRSRLGAEGRRQREWARAALPQEPRAARSYAEGLERLWAREPAAARAALERAVAAEPEFAPAHAALSAAWAALGHEGRARRHAAEGLARSGELPPTLRLRLEARAREAAYQWEAAAEIYRSLLLLHGDDLEAGLRLAAVLTTAGQGEEALAVVERLAQLPVAAAADPRLDLAEASAAAALIAERRAQAAAARAADKARRAGARLLQAQALNQEGVAWLQLDEPDAAMRAAEEAASLFAALGDNAGLARTDTLRGSVLRDRGEMASARAAYERALARWRQLGDEASAASTHYGLAAVLWQEGDRSGGRRHLERSLAIYRQLGHRRGEAIALALLGDYQRQLGEYAAARASYAAALAASRAVGDRRTLVYAHSNLGNLLRDEGDLPGAQRSYEAGLAAGRELADRRTISLLLHNLGGVRRLRGELPAARAAYEEAIALRRSAGGKANVAGSLRALGKVLLAQADLAAARRAHEEALAIRRELGGKGSVAASQMSLAEVALAEGRPQEALGWLDEVVETFRREERRDDEAYAEAIGARALAAGGQPARAQAAAARALAAAQASGSREAVLTVVVAGEQLRAAASACGAASLGDAVQALERAAGEAQQAGFVLLAVEARLARWQTAARCAPAGDAPAQLAALQRDARGRGLLLLAGDSPRPASGPSPP